MKPSAPLPNSIVVRVLPRPVEGVAVCLTLEMTVKNDFNYTIFLDHTGIIELGVSELVQAFDWTREFFVMDYSDPRTHFDGKISARVLSDSELAHAMTAFENFNGKYPFPENYEKNLRAAIRRGQNPADYDIELESDILP